MTLEARDFLDALLSADTPEDVLLLWLSRPELQDEVINAHPEIVGAMDGIPALVRVAANRLNAPDWIAEAEADLAVEGISDERAAFLRSEIAYLKQVLSDDAPVQLYLYDRDSSRIVEMIGTPSPETEKVITYVPGTFTSLGDFYRGGAQQIAGYLADQVPGTVAFVYKDGPFPGENTDVGGIDMFRIGEANDEDRALAAGRQLARFEAGMRADPLLGAAEQDALGHSLGAVERHELRGRWGRLRQGDLALGGRDARSVEPWAGHDVHRPLLKRHPAIGAGARDRLGREQSTGAPGFRARRILRRAA